MFEPENDIERLLMRASAEPAERPAFARALMDAEIFLVLVPEGGDPIVPGPDGNAVIPEGTKMTLPSAVRGEERLIPFFTAPIAGARLVQERPRRRCRTRTRDLFARYPGAPFVLNPGSDYGKDYTPGEVAADAGGRFRPERPADCHRRRRRSRSCWRIPRKSRPHLIEALAREFAGLKSVRGAWLMLAMRAARPNRAGCSASITTGRGRTFAMRSAARSLAISSAAACSMPCRSTAVHSPSPCVPEFPSPPPSAASSISS